MSIPETDPAMAEAPRPRRRLVSWVFGAVALSALIGSIWYAYEHGLRRAEQNLWFRFTEAKFDSFMQAQKL